MSPQQDKVFDPDANAASVAIVADGQVLLIQRAFEPLAGLWTFPGGRREPGETVERTASREIREEMGLAIRHMVPVLAMPISGGYMLQIFATMDFEGAITPSDEVADMRWAPPDGLGSLPTTPGLKGIMAAALSRLEARRRLGESGNSA